MQNETLLKSICTLNDNNAKDFIRIMFDGYLKRKDENRLYERDGMIAKNIIAAYYSCVTKNKFDDIFGEFKKKYIYNESSIEDAHTKDEKRGLGKAYDFVQELEDFSNVDIYSMITIHKRLFSCMPYPEFGGTLRQSPATLSSTAIELCPPEYIITEMQKLYLPSKKLVADGVSISGENKDFEAIFHFIEDVVKLNVKLIKIHPFADGNGRTVRTFINLLFKTANIPPIYIRTEERKEYLEAMDLALADKEYNPDYSKIITFYLYKICDSLIELDLDYIPNKVKTK